MDSRREEALKAKEIAEKRFLERDFSGAKSFALKAQTLYPELEGISQMVATFEVYVASEIKRNGIIDYHAILGLNPSADKDAVRKQYKKMALLLHPDQNRCVGADGAFKLVSEAWNFLSDGIKKRSYDFERKKQKASGIVQTNNSAYATVFTGGCPNSSTSHGRLDTFWTVCTSCKVQYEYLRKYVNKRLSCKNCRGTFIAVETGAAPVSGSFPYSPWSYLPGNVYAGHRYEGVTYTPPNGTYFTGNGVSGYHSGHGYEYTTNVTYRWNSYSGVSAMTVDPNELSARSADYVYQTSHGGTNGGRIEVNYGVNGTPPMKNSTANVSHSNIYFGGGEPSAQKAGRPEKKRRVSWGSSYRNGYDERGSKSDSEPRPPNGSSNTGLDLKLRSANDTPSRRFFPMPAYDARKMLMDKARTQIQKKLKEMKLAAEAAAAAVAAAAAARKEYQKGSGENGKSLHVGRVSKRGNLITQSRLSGSNKNGPLTISVPDPDFHDFDRDRTEECFKPKQIWAIYDEDDGMPRLYCMIRDVVSVHPFKIQISYLNSKTDTEFGSVNWVDSGFTKSCGHFRAWNSDVVEQVNIFSHLLKGAKAGRGGCVRIFPKCGDVWAVYRNWSPDWDRTTPDEIRHQYEMVEILADYSEDIGVCVAPLIKLEGFKTVYQRSTDKAAVRLIPRREMVRFSHQVPSWLIKGESSDLPDNCWDLDPAATPEELLNAAGSEAKS